MITVTQESLLAEVPRTWYAWGEGVAPNRHREIFLSLKKYMFSQKELMILKAEIDWYYAIKENRQWERRKEK